jgi:hypothetical protein
MTRKQASRPPAAFTPVPVRPRADGWTPERQTGFIQALAASANVEAAAREVGMTTSSAYTLRARPDATSFREAWDIAVEYAVQRLGDAVLARAITGVATPIFYKGEQVGERRRYDERLAMFILRMRDPERFGSWREGRVPLEPAEFTAERLTAAVDRVAFVAAVTESGRKTADIPPLPAVTLITGEQKTILDATVLQEELRQRTDGTSPQTDRPPRENDAEVDPEGGM